MFQVWHGSSVFGNLSGYGNHRDMSTTSGGDTTHMQENSVTTLYDGDRTVVNHRVSPPSSSNADSGLENSNPESSAGDAKLIIDVPDFSKGIIILIFNGKC